MTAILLLAGSRWIQPSGAGGFVLPSGAEPRAYRADQRAARLWMPWHRRRRCDWAARHAGGEHDDHLCLVVCRWALLTPIACLQTHVGDMGQRSDAAFVAVNFVSRWLYTRDVAFLTDSFQTESLGWAREKVTPYDLLKDVAAFWMCYLEVSS